MKAISTILFASLLIFTLCAATLSCSKSEGSGNQETPGGSSSTDPDNVIPPGDLTSTNVIHKYGRAIVPFAAVDKAGDYYRRMFIDSASAVYVRTQGRIPDRAILYLETWFGNRQSTVFIRQKINNEWRSTSFDPGRPDYAVSLISSCNGCHADARSTDNTFTEPLLKKAMTRGAVQKIVCNETSTTPCDLSVYQGN